MLYDELLVISFRAQQSRPAVTVKELVGISMRNKL